MTTCNHDDLCFQEIPQAVNTWKKFLELRCIIDSSLQNIEDRWNDGKVSDYDSISVWVGAVMCRWGGKWVRGK